MFAAKISESKVVARIAANPQVGGTPLAVHFEGSATSESGAAIVSYIWDFGDGAAANGAKIDHTFTDKKGYTIHLTATDANGEKGESFANVTVSDFTLTLAADSAEVVPGNSGTSVVSIRPAGPS